MKNSNFFCRLLGHTKTITLHKLRVTRFCFQLGLIKQGLAHDLSKYSWIEFSSGVRYYQGFRSPIDAEKEAIGYSEGWLHHKGRNKHHWEYWLDKNRTGLVPVEIPKRFIAEMVCDRLAACRTYQKENYTQSSALVYFESGTDKNYMHPHSANLLRQYLTWISAEGQQEGFKKIKHDLKTY